jgi:hypothetical protein
MRFRYPAIPLSRRDKLSVENAAWGSPVLLSRRDILSVENAVLRFMGMLSGIILHEKKGGICREIREIGCGICFFLPTVNPYGILRDSSICHLKSSILNLLSIHQIIKSINQ